MRIDLNRLGATGVQRNTPVAPHSLKCVNNDLLPTIRQEGAVIIAMAIRPDRTIYGRCLKSMDVTIIVAHSLNGVIGKGGASPWHLPTDLRFFRRQTEGHIVIMGRKTYESLGKPLPNRRNIVLSRHLSAADQDVEVYRSIDDVKAELTASKPTQQEIFVIGGGQIYEAFLPDANRIYITLVEAVVAGDTYFPRLTDCWHVELLEAYDRPPQQESTMGLPWYPHRMYRLTRCSPSGKTLADQVG